MAMGPLTRGNSTKKSLRDLDAERESQEAAKRWFEMGKRERDGKAL
jgi:hypothetical protein